MSLKNSVLAGCVLAMMVGCSNEDFAIERKPSIDEYIQSGAQDLAGGKLFHIIDEDDWEAGKLPLKILRAVDITPVNGPSEYFKLECKEIDGQWYAVPTQLKPLDKPYEIVPLLIAPKEYPEEGRHILFALRRRTLSDTEDDKALSDYSEVLGKGTYSFMNVGAIKPSVLNNKEILKLREEGFFTAYTNSPQLTMVEFSGDSYKKTMENWAFNLGVSFQKSVPATIADITTIKPRGKVIPRGGTLKPARVWSGTFNFGMNGNVSESEAYEYYFNFYNVKMAEAFLNMSIYQRENPDPSILVLTTDLFKEDIVRDPFSAEKFFDDWGTDVITQGSFGGYNVYIYGRKANAYESSLGLDASAKLKCMSPATAGSNWLQVYKNKSSDYISGDANADYMTAEYEAASETISAQFTTGGDLAVNDPQKWLDGFSENQDGSNWALTSYRINSTPTDEDVDCLYPIEDIVYHLLCAYDDKVEEKTERDLALLQIAIRNYDSLVEAKQAYLEKHSYDQKTATPMVLADFLMLNSENGHKETRKQQVRKGPDGKYRIYRPLVANKNVPGKQKEGGYLETSSADFINNVDDKTDQIWWVALDYQDECVPIKSICFMDEDDDPNLPYEKRGNRADHDMTYAAIDNHYVHIAYLQKSDNIAPITGVAIVRRGDKDGSDKHPYRVIASSIGTDMLLPYNSEDNQDQFHYYWGANYKYYADDIRYGKEGAPYEIGVMDMATKWDEGDGWFGKTANPGTENNWLMPGITRKPLKKPLKYTEVTPW